MLFVQANCPVCMEDQVAPPTVALACGHVLCQDDFIKIGGRVGQAAVDPFVAPTTDNDEGDNHHLVPLLLPGEGEELPNLTELAEGDHHDHVIAHLSLAQMFL
jgi:hypothetical protein